MQKKTFFIAWALFVIAVLASVTYVATTTLKIQDLKNVDMNDKSAISPSPQPSSSPIAQNTQFQHPVLGYLFTYPARWKISTNKTSRPGSYDYVTIKSPDYKLSEGYPFLESGYSIAIRASDTSEVSVQALFNNDSLATSLAKNEHRLKVDGVDAIQFDYSYEGTIATVTMFVKDGVYYQIVYRYSDEALKNTDVKVYEEVLSSFKVNHP